MKPSAFHGTTDTTVDLSPPVASAISDRVMRSVNAAPLRHHFSGPKTTPESEEAAHDLPKAGEAGVPKRLGRRPSAPGDLGPPLGSLEDELKAMKSAKTAVELSNSLKRVRAAGRPKPPEVAAKPDAATPPAEVKPDAKPAAKPDSPPASPPADPRAPGEAINPVVRPRQPRKQQPPLLPFPSVGAVEPTTDASTPAVPPANTVLKL